MLFLLTIMTTTLILLSTSWFALAIDPYIPTSEEFKHLRPWFEPEEKITESYFEEYIKSEGRKYTDESQKQERFEIFKLSMDKINTLHTNSDRYHAIYDFTKFMDVTSEEFSSTKNGLSGFIDLSSTKACKYLHDKDIKFHDAPESFDWREYDAVTPVKDQDKCGCSFAFSAIGNIEGQNAVKNKELVSLSEQQILDCDRTDTARSGGMMNVAMRWLINKGGSISEDDYPYRGKVGSCNFDTNKVKLKISDCHSFNLTSQEKLKQLLYGTGPIAIGIRGTNLQFYSKGIIADVNCNEGEINHGVLLVGYGSENGIPFWTVKNSWGTSFGESGYFRMDRGEKASSCGVMNDYMASAILD